MLGTDRHEARRQAQDHPVSRFPLGGGVWSRQEVTTEPTSPPTAALQRELSMARRSLGTVLEAVPYCVEIVDSNFRIVVANKAASDYLGLAPGELLDQRCYAIHAERTAPCPDCPVAEALHTGEPATATHRRSKSNGEIVHRRTAAHPLKDEYGRVVRVAKLSVDVGAGTEQENSVPHTARLSSVSELAVGVAHRINNPLTAIIGNAQLMLRDLSPDDPNHGAARTIERAGLRAKAVIGHLLEFSQQQDYDFGEVDVNVSLWAALTAISPQLQQNNVRIVTDLAADSPRIVASAKHLHVVWENLLLNARDAIERGQGEGKITIVSSPSPDGRQAVVFIRDTGCGIPAESMDKLFEPFFTTKDPNADTGLGLYSCYVIVTAHKGSIEVESQPGEGTTFSVSLPIP